MAQIGISITKRCVFRDSTQEWNNVYHYGSTTIDPPASEAEALLDELVALEKTWHSTQVSFVYGRVWNSGGTQAQNDMIFEKILTGTGATGDITSLDRERALLVMWPAGVDSRGHKVYLRKWYHTCGVFPGVTWAAGELANQSGMSSGELATISSTVDAVTRLSGTAGTEVWGLVAESGRERDGGAPTAHKYLEHHQFGDQWRG